jgi:hypothetical protein
MNSAFAASLFPPALNGGGASSGGIPPRTPRNRSKRLNGAFLFVFDMVTADAVLDALESNRSGDEKFLR